MDRIKFSRCSNIIKDIKQYKKREPFEFTNSYLIKVAVATFSYLIPATILLLVFDKIAMAFFAFPLLITAPFALIANEFIKLSKKKKASQNLDEVVNVLKENNVNTNVEDFSRSVVIDNLIVNEEEKKNTWNYCYVFEDNNNELQGLLEDNKHLNNKYYLLNNEEIHELEKSKELRDYHTKIKVLKRSIDNYERSTF